MLTANNKICMALAGWLSWLERHLVHKKVAGAILSQGAYEKQLMDVLFLSHNDVSLSLSLPLSLQSISIFSG